MDKVALQQLIGSQLKKYREENHLTQEGLAEKAGISPSYCANLERGKKSMSLHVLREISDALQINAVYLLYEEQTDTRLQNIITLLKDQPDQTIIFIEKMIRLWLEALVSAKQDSP